MFKSPKSMVKEVYAMVDGSRQKITLLRKMDKNTWLYEKGSNGGALISEDCILEEVKNVQPN